MIDQTSVGKQVIAYATPNRGLTGPELGRGIAVAYVPVPMFLIQRADGTEFWWRADQMEEINGK